VIANSSNISKCKTSIIYFNIFVQIKRDFKWKFNDIVDR
jgi:hypothetical protein